MTIYDTANSALSNQRGGTTKRERELSPEEWWEEIENGLRYRRRYGLEDRWSDLEKIFDNVHDSQINAGPNIIMATADSLMSSLTVPNPYITVKPARTDGVATASLVERLDNEIIEDSELNEEFEKASLATFLFGVSIFKIGFDSLHGFDPRYDSGVLFNTTLGMTSTHLSKKSGKRIEFGRNKPGHPWIKFVMPHDFVVPWGTVDLADAPWCAHRVVRHISEVRSDAKYEHVRDIQPSISLEDYVKSYETVMKTYRMGEYPGVKSHQDMQSIEYVELWEIRDRRTQQVIVIATGHDKFLRKQPDLLQLNGQLPFVRMSFVPRCRRFWVTPDAYYLQQVQLELSDISVQNTKHRRARVLKYLVRRGLISEDEMENLLSADVGVMAEVDNQAEIPLNQVVMPLQVQADMGLMQEAEFTRRNAREMIGLSSNQVGEFDSSSRRSATEASIVARASTIRMDRRQLAVARAYKNIFKVVNPIVFKYMESPISTQILGPDGQLYEQDVLGKDLENEYRYQVGFSIDPPESLQSRRQNAMQTYLMLRQDPLIDPVGLARNLVYSINDAGFAAIFKPGVLQGDPNAMSQIAQSQPGMGGGGSQAVQASGQGIQAPNRKNLTG